MTAAQAFEIIALNKNGVKPDSLKPEEEGKKGSSPFVDLLNQDAINRFDKKKKKKKKKSGGGGDKASAGGNNAAAAANNGDKPSNDATPNGKSDRSNGKNDHNKPRQGNKPKRQQQGDKPSRQERQPKPVKTFRPRHIADNNTPQQGGNDQ